MNRFLTVFLILLINSSTAVAEDKVFLTGNFIQGRLVRGKTTPGSKIHLDQETVRIALDGIFFLAFPHNSKPVSELKVLFPSGKVEHRDLKITQRRYTTQYIDGLPARKVRPRPEDLKRISGERSFLKKAHSNLILTHTFVDMNFIWPAIGTISGVFGSRRVLNSIPKKPHLGIDIAAPEGTPVRSTTNGKVLLIHQDLFFNGKTIYIDHGLGLISIYIHLSKIYVKTGETIVTGQTIGEIGSTGRATGPHLHWEIRLENIKLDPKILAGPMPPKS